MFMVEMYHGLGNRNIAYNNKVEYKTAHPKLIPHSDNPTKVFHTEMFYAIFQVPFCSVCYWLEWHALTSDTYPGTKLQVLWNLHVLLEEFLKFLAHFVDCLPNRCLLLLGKRYHLIILTLLLGIFNTGRDSHLSDKLITYFLMDRNCSFLVC